MRGWTLLIGLLLIPGGAAQSLEWLAPTDAVANAPVFVAYRMDDGSGGLEGHVNVRLSVALDGHELFGTDQIHEHEGIHTFTFMPPASGNITLTAVAAAKETTHTIHVQDGGQREPPAFPSARFIAGTNVMGNNDALRGGDSIRVAGTSGWALVDGRDDAGIARFSSWQSESSGGSMLRGEPAHVAGVFTDSPLVPEGHGARFVDGGSWDHAAESDQPIVLPGLPRPPRCEDAGLQVVLDPNSLSPAGNPQFQEHASVRVAILDNPFSEVQYILYESISEVSMRSVLGTSAIDPFAQAMFFPGNEGSMRLLVRGQGGEASNAMCTVFFDVTPNPAEPGTVDTYVEHKPLGVNVTFTPLDASGQVITHYEFDTRVMRMEDTGVGRLVYQGKLHGHPGATSFSLSNLEPGDYRMWTLPSPQDAAAPPVAPDATEGFVTMFVVDEPSEGEPMYAFSKEPGVAQEKSTPLQIAAPLLIGLVWLTARRSTPVSATP